MPEITAYGTSIFSNTGWTGGGGTAALLGAPDGVTATSNTVNHIVRVRMAGFAALGTNDRIDQVFIGCRVRSTTTTPTNNFYLETGGGIGCADETRKNVQLAAGQVGALIDLEYALDASQFTPDALKHADFRAVFHKSVSTTVFEVDALWVRVVYTPRPDALAVTKHADTVSGTSPWTSPANAVGAPNDVFASTLSSGNTLNLNMGGLATLPDDAVLIEVRSGLRYKANSTASYVTFTVTPAASPPVLTHPLLLNTSDTKSGEVSMDPAVYTVAVLKQSTLKFNVTKASGTGNFQIDSVWIRALYSLPSAGASRAKRWTGSAWADAPVQRWDGTKYVSAAVKRWDGSAWV